MVEHRKISVVILNWNGLSYLRRFLPLLVERSRLPGVEIVVADNASTDDSCAFVRETFPELKLITLDRNYGFAEGYNRALSLLEADYFILLNSDVEVAQAWLPPLIHYMEEHPDVAACQPKIRSLARPDRFEHAGASGGFLDRYGYPFCRGRIFTTLECDTGQYDTVIEIFWATGACLMIRSEDFRSAGGLDGDFFAHMEEIDLCWRLKNKGHKIVCVPQSVVFHVGGGALHAEHPRKTYLNFRNNLLLLYKNLPERSFRKVLLLRSLLDFLAALQLCFSGRPKNALSILRA